MKTVSPQRWQQIESLLDEVLDLPPARRSAHLAAACGDDLALQEAVARLVVACEQPTVAALHPPGAAPVLAALGRLPERLGPYRLVAPLGEGGMGVVFLAERDDAQFRQQVAIKVLRHGWTRPEAIERFRHERQVLAGLDHPGIARLLDGGVTPDGLPYLVMERIEGMPLDRYCLARALDLPARLRLMEAVTAAVQHAHEQLVVHRDLKPANVLVTADGTVKLLDFGIAKLLDAEAGRDTPMTRTEMRVMTPEYAAPEQVRGERITAATDVYALGVVLYELLTGARPYALTGRSLGEVERVISDTTPPRPSAMAGRVGGGTPSSRRLRGDLDTIVMKALQKDPARRYPTAAALLEDLVRYREGRPVLARPDTIAYRVSKYVRRHAWGVAGVAALAAIMSWAGLRERALRGVAEAEAASATAAAAFLSSVFEGSDPYAVTPEPADSVSARELLDRGAERLDSTLAADPVLRARMRTLLGRIYGNLSVYDRAAGLLEASVTERRHLGDEVALAESLNELGAVYVKLARHAEADSVLQEAIALWRRQSGDHRLGLSQALDRYATSLQDRNQYAEAEPIFLEVLALRLAVGAPAELAAAESYNNLGLIRWFASDFVGAESLYRRSAEIRARRLGPRHAETAGVLHNIAQAMQLQGKLDSAEALYRTSLEMKRVAHGNAHPSVTVHLNNLGRLLKDRGKLAEAEPLVREALALDRQIFGEVHPYVAASLDNLGGVLLERGAFDEAEEAILEARAINVAVRGEEHTAVALNDNSIGLARLRRGDAAGAVVMHRRALERYLRLVGPDNPNSITVSGNLGVALREVGQLVEAESLGRAVVAALEERLPATQLRLGTALVNLGRTLLAAGQPAEALPLLERGYGIVAEGYPGGDWRVAEAQLGLGMALRALGRTADAAPHLASARRTLQAVRARQPQLAALAARAADGAS